ncbi:NnrS family protein [Corticibacter populi]|uniref:NnrS family protein n=2 Tax=Corticibacter populi TaxID=1550736 RepID=A0A3M6QTF8_9BURK|nr:NnrS family protein [Corticibacter populi]
MAAQDPILHSIEEPGGRERRAWALRWLGAAPHRLMFFVGAANLLLAMLWWSWWLAAARWPAVLPLPMTPQPPGWLHAFTMQFQVLPSFFFGFLLTVFPRWMGLQELRPWQYLPVGLGMFGGQALVLLGAAGLPGAGALIALGLAATLLGWGTGLVWLGRWLREAGQINWHARSCFAAMLLGWLAIAVFAAGLWLGHPVWVQASLKVGAFGLLLPVYLSVAHRMFPFFAGNVVPGYVPWRPLWWLAAVWLLALAHLVPELAGRPAWLAWRRLPDAAMLALALLTLWKWWPRRVAPGLLKVLFIGLLWWPVTFVLLLLQSWCYAAHGTLLLGRAPAHALFIGLFGSLLVAMVTRVTQGHSGGRLYMPWVAWFAFIGIQLVAVLRIGAELAPDPHVWLVSAALGWLLALAPWVARIGSMYLRPRVDGKPG